jgi:hypothetical protein
LIIETKYKGILEKTRGPKDDTGYWILDVGCWVQDTSDKIKAL